MVTVPAGTDFAEAARSINAAVRQGVDVRGVLVAGDDAVLIGNRLEWPLPIVDEADIDKADDGRRWSFSRWRRTDSRCRVLADPLALRAALQAALVGPRCGDRAGAAGRRVCARSTCERST